MAAAFFAQRTEVGVAFQKICIGLVELLGGHRTRVDESARYLGALDKTGTIGVRDTQHVADDNDRQRVREQPHQITFAGADEVVDQIVGDAPNPFSHAFDTPRIKRFDHQAPQPRMVGRILQQHCGGKPGDGRVFHGFGALFRADIRILGMTQALIAQRAGNVLIPRQDPRAGVRHVQNRMVLAQKPVGRIRIGNEFRGENRFDGQCGFGHVQHLLSISLARDPRNSCKHRV